MVNNVINSSEVTTHMNFNIGSAVHILFTDMENELTVDEIDLAIKYLNLEKERIKNKEAH